MKPQKIYSIIIGLVAYIIISHIFHVFFRGKTDSIKEKGASDSRFPNC